MDAIKYFKEKKRMTNDCTINCMDCKLNHFYNGTKKFCKKFEFEHPEKAIAIVEKWAEEHPSKTRQSEFLKLFPKVEINNEGTINICPKVTERIYRCSYNERKVDCDECRKEYWLAEIEEEE